MRFTEDEAMNSSPEAAPPRGAKEARTSNVHGDAMDGNAGDLMQIAKDLEEKIDEEQRKAERGMNIMAINAVDVSEVFSPPRVVEMARAMGLVAGKSMELVNGWDFSKFQHRRQAMEIMRKDQPLLIVGSPPCTVFSVLQALNIHKNGPD